MVWRTKRMIGDLALASEILGAGDLIGKDRADQILGTHARELRRHLPAAAKARQRERHAGDPAPARGEHRGVEHGLDQHRPHARQMVDKRQAALAEGEQNVAQLKAGFDSALADVDEATAQRDRAKDAYERFRKGNDNAKAAGRDLPFSLADVENRRTTYLAAEGSLQAANAKAEQARVVYQSQIGGVHTSVARLRADLRDAEFDLDRTTVRAPGPGFVTQVALRPGMYVIPAPLRPVMVFVHGDDHTLAAGFQQNALQRVRAGDEAEVAFDAVPGQIFKGKVLRVLDAIAAGQFQASGSLQDMGEWLPGGRAVAVIDLDKDITSYNLPGGAAAQVALYTPYWHHFAIIRRILLRMRSWENYVFLEGH